MTKTLLNNWIMKIPEKKFLVCELKNKNVILCYCLKATKLQVSHFVVFHSCKELSHSEIAKLLFLLLVFLASKIAFFFFLHFSSRFFNISSMVFVSF